MKKFSILIVIIILLLTGCRKTTQAIIHGDQEITYTVEIADTKLKQAKGLMFRKSLGEREGMLFVYKRPADKHFWMKYTKLQLDIVFINKEKRIINIEEALPCLSSPCQRYHSRGRALYVLEINQGQCKIHGFKKGTRVDFIF